MRPADDCLVDCRLDYCGIAFLIMGSFVPWVYYGFYCHYEHKLVYLSVVVVLGMCSIVVSLYDKFSEPQLRPLRAGVFASFGLSGIIPAVHYACMEGWFNNVSQASLGWLILMGNYRNHRPNNGFTDRRYFSQDCCTS